LQNVICGYTNDKDKQFAAAGGRLKYYRVEYVPISKRFYYEYANELLLHIRELVELENGVNFIGNS
jgi:adenine-specific DNA-methyltransferase